MKKTISIEWSISDIKDRKKELTDEQCSEILEILENSHDASIGINWEVIDIRIDEYLNEVSK